MGVGFSLARQSDRCLLYRFRIKALRRRALHRGAEHAKSSIEWLLNCIRETPKRKWRLYL